MSLITKEHLGFIVPEGNLFSQLAPFLQICWTFKWLIYHESSIWGKSQKIKANLHKIVILAQRCTIQEMQSVRPPVVITRQERSFRDPYFDDGCDLLPHHRALQSEPPHLQKEQLSHVGYTLNTLSGCVIWCNLVKGNKQQLTTKSRPRQSTSAGTPLWGLQVFLGYRTSLRKKDINRFKS